MPEDARNTGFFRHYETSNLSVLQHAQFMTSKVLVKPPKLQIRFVAVCSDYAQLFR